MPRPSRRHLLGTLLAATLVLMLVDLAGGPGPGALRVAGGAVFGPLERVLAPGRPADAAPLRSVVDTARLAQESVAGPQLRQLLGMPAIAGGTVVPARVIAVGRQGASGPERVTIDAGSRDGIHPDLCVVSAAGVVGRVVAVSPWTADVLLVGSADLVVGVRVGAAGTLGSVGSGARGPHPRPAGELGLTLVQRGTVAPGDVVTTMGSVGGVPFPPGLPVGTVATVDDSPGDLAPGAAVRPAVDVTTLDVVGVLTAPPPRTPRPALTAGR
ncbi:rod shape-determining protein MreC [Nostocoides sp. HKS02]|uniref:rod shape-determining protein MreC n=1 Tax=Nostocoides sp. HKS02 TaxID=1813880 RepID=UPI0012B4B6D6|nr:rod shape-determining protein MreC [Tetrasphaera sp. HKS02]QGN56911.1 rod shape-determining protein MreC [Tetrasphaera sp. HKS02]